ncbi:MAG: LysR family transcriptional regulator [Motiliproteus sp.]
MDIKLLEDFVCLANLQNFTAAARERRVTQSAFSRRIKALEEWLGTVLINRECTSFELTPQGSLFVAEAEAILRRLYNAREAVRAMGSSGESEIAVAAQNSIAQTLFLNWVKRLEKRLDSVYVRLISEKLPDCIELFSQGHVDYMFCYANDLVSLPIDENRFSYTTIGKETLIPVSVPLKHPKKPTFALPGDAGSPVPFVAYTHDSLFGKAIDRLIQDKGHSCFLARRYENAFSHTLKSMVIERLGFAWLPKSSILSDLKEGKLCRAGDERWDIEFDIRLYYHHAARSTREQAVVETSLEMAAELLR